MAVIIFSILMLLGQTLLLFSFFFMKGRGAIRADFGPMSEINFVVITI